MMLICLVIQSRRKKMSKGKYSYTIPHYLTDLLFKEVDETGVKPNQIVKRILEEHFLTEEEEH